MKNEVKYSKSDTQELTSPNGGRDFTISSSLLDCDNNLIKAMVAAGGHIEYAKRVRLEFRDLGDATRRDLIYMSIPTSIRKPTVKGLKFGYTIINHASFKIPKRDPKTGTIKPSRTKIIIHFSLVDEDTGRFMIFGPETEMIVKLNENKEVLKKDVPGLMSKMDSYFSKLDRLSIALDQEEPVPQKVKLLNRELIGAMMRTTRRTSDVANIDDLGKNIALKIPPRLQDCSWVNKKSKLQLWRIAFNNVFDVSYINSLGLEVKVQDSVSTVSRKYKGDEAMSAEYEIPVLGIISGALVNTMITVKNFQDTVLPVEFDIKKFL